MNKLADEVILNSHLSLCGVLKQRKIPSLDADYHRIFCCTCMRPRAYFHLLNELVSAKSCELSSEKL